MAASMRSSSAPGSTRSPAPRCSRNAAGACACSSARSGSAAASTRPTTSRCPGSRTRCWRRGIRSGRVGGAYAELKDELDRRGRRVRQHRPPDRHRLPRRLGGVHPRLSGGERRRAGLARSRGRRRVGAFFNGFMANADLAFGAARHRALVDRGSRSRADGPAPVRSPRAARVRRRHARHVPRLGDGDLPLRGRARAAGAVGAAHRARPGPGDLRLHDAGDRRRAPARRHAGAVGWRPRAGRRRSPGSSAMPAARCGPAPTSSGSSSRAARRPVCGSPDGEVVAAERAVVAGVTPTQLYGRLLGAGEVPDDGDRARRSASATAAPRCRSTSRSTRRRAGRATGRPSSHAAPSST